MNILLFVMTLLLVMSSISYQALNRYQNGAMIRRTWDKTMRVDTICQYNAIVEAEYEHLRKNDGGRSSGAEGESSKADEEPGAEGASKIDFRFITDPKYPEFHPKEFPLMQEVLERLILSLYADMNFLKELLQRRPQVVIELFDALRKVNADLPEKQRYNSIKKLIKMPLKDPELETLRYELLRNSPVSSKMMELLNFKPAGEKDSGASDCIEVSLKDFLIEKRKKKIRVYLAPRAILYAVFQDMDAVEQVVAYRLGLYREVSRKEEPRDAGDATKDFREYCTSFAGINDLEPILDFAVTTTKPGR